METADAAELRALLQWYLDAGVDETIGLYAVDRLASRPPEPVGVPDHRDAAAPSTAPRPSRPPGQSAAAARPTRASPRPPMLDADRPVQDATALAGAATTLDALRRALDSFDGCPLKRTATNLVFGRGHPQARLVCIGEAPGAEEDRQGLPFVGPSGRLLDRILASIDISESDVFISNTVFWRPPGNRPPTSAETAACMPFLHRLLELIAPAVLVCLGGPAAQALLARTESVGKLRGRWFSYQTPGLSRPVAATATFHPAYLLRTPQQKRLAWRDWLGVRDKLHELGASGRAPAIQPGSVPV
ncbi:MAG: uracil-DNA glycosylase [Rhodospirillales bacterium]|nr:MAG: uracil-DNA glycosylase [Rhodospirillales bacterium]